MMKFKPLFLMSALLLALSCGGGGGNDLPGDVEGDIPADVLDVIQDLPAGDVDAVHPDLPVELDTTSDVETIDDITTDDGTEDVRTDIEELPDTCECAEDGDCQETFADLGACEAATCDGCTCQRVFVEDGTTCDDNNQCTSGETCTSHVCGGGNNTCLCSADTDCDRYNDEDLCNGSFKCNLTLATPACEIPADTIPVCEDTLGLFCRTVGCEPTTGNCVDIPLHEGEGCDDGIPCTTGDTCLAGVCGGTVDDAACNDNEVCTDEYCDPLQGCVYVNNDESCSDSNACTENDYCSQGACTPGTAVNCDDGNVCTFEECDSSLGCVVTNAIDLACDDLDPCTAGSTCEAGACVATAEGCCGDTVDNDGDDLPDCLDPDCVGACPVEMFECALVEPATFTGAQGETFELLAMVKKAGVTDKTTGFDGHPYLRVQYGVAPKDTVMNDLAEIAWLDATADSRTNDPETDFWTGTVTVPELMDMSLERDYMVRVSGDQGTTWSYCDIDGTLNGYDYNQAGKMTIKAPYNLMFSEYMEGSSYYKALEIFNAGEYPANLGNCVVNLYTNGASAPSKTEQLGAVVLAPGGVFTLCNNQIAAAAQANCDVLTANINHNGDDAYDIVCDGVVQDVFGVIGVDPGTGWGEGETATIDRTLRRKCALVSGTGPAPAAFDQTQWIGFSRDTWLGLGVRLCSGDCYYDEAETCCGDTIDNDLDGVADCNDVSCKKTEACFIPVDWCQYVEPAAARGSAGMAGMALAWVRVAGKTDVTAENDNPAGVIVEFGYGPTNTIPDGNWQWNPAEPNFENTSPDVAADTYRSNFVVPDVPVGFYDMAFRASADGGYSWKLCDLNGSDDDYSVDQAGKAEVVTPPVAFFSEYVDGTGNNKAVEIFNNSGRSIDLDLCMIAIFSNGSTTPSMSFRLENGILADGDVYVVCRDGVTPELYSFCDESRSLLQFDGNDTVALTCEDKPQDVIGQRGVNPGDTGWNTAGVSTYQMTLRRNCMVAFGDISPDDPFNVAAQWLAFPLDIYAGLGSMQCGDPCADGGMEFCCEDDMDNDIDGLSDCMDPDCVDTLECQPLLVELAMLNTPLALTYEYGTVSPNVYAQGFLTGVTTSVGQGAGIRAQAGWGPDGSDPTGAGWTWTEATYFQDKDVSDDQYTATFAGVPVGTWDFAFRFTADDGGHWLYADAEPDGSLDGYNAANAGSITVEPGTELLCGDDIDNDGDTNVDCLDTDCFAAPNCSEGSNCADGQDNDIDGMTDCDDLDCFVNPICHVPVDWCQMQPTEMVISAPGPYFQVFGWVQKAGITDVTVDNDDPTGLSVQFAWGAAGSDPATWSWYDGAVSAGGNTSPNPSADTWVYNMFVPDVVPGLYEFAVRTSADDGKSWTYCDQDGSANGFDQPGQAGKMMVSLPANVMITEYVEGTVENKALEITNLSDRPVMMSMCTVTGYANGASTLTFSSALDSSGYIPAHSSFVVCDDGADAVLAPYCDSLSTLLAFNGDDALVLACEERIQDVVGQVGFDPGTAWGVDPIITTNKTLRRACGVASGDGIANDTFEPAMEWFSFPVDTFLDLGNWVCGDPCYVSGGEDCCGDSFDNDFDGQADCLDDDCVLTPECIPENETVCDDTIDEDMDGTTDCDDADCASDINCADPVDWCQTMENQVVIGQEGAIFRLYAFVREVGMTDVTTGNDNPAGLAAEFGWGPTGSDPATWTWAPAQVAAGNFGPDIQTDTYMYDLTVPTTSVGDYDFAFRFTISGGTLWLNCDQDGSDNGFTLPGLMTVTSAPNLFFTEYVEGSSNNKALEIINMSGRDVLLSQCRVNGFNNGGTDPTYSILLDGGILADGGKFVVCNSSGGDPLKAQCNQTTSALGFNGDDAVVLECESSVQDVFGQVGFDPGSAWVSGDASTVNMTLRRMCGTTAGDLIRNDTFDPAAQWHAFPNDSFLDLGFWDCDDPCYVDAAETCCTDVGDNDRDGLADCLDPDCAAEPACIPTSETNCADTIDEDVDGFTDCDDMDCAGDVACAPASETVCDDTIDEDMDGSTDCDDPDCAADPVCIPTTETACNDTIDEDVDGFTDCDDTDCAADPVCTGSAEANCGDTIDDDGDTLIDCDDPDCDDDTICPVKVMFSEYGEGSSNNKWIEVWNYGTATRDLSGCIIQVYANGASTNPSQTTLSQTAAAAGDIWTVCNTSITATGTTCDQKSGSISFTGDDAVILNCGGVVRDSIGMLGNDPGTFWGTEPNTTTNHTLCRSDRTPDVTPADAFDPATQWAAYAVDTFSGMDVLACP